MTSTFRDDVPIGTGFIVSNCIIKKKSKESRCWASTPRARLFLFAPVPPPDIAQHKSNAN
jgi:hypothetical protein